MTGRSGVAARLHSDIPHVVNIHYVAYHLALVSEDTDACPAIKIYEKTIKDLYNYLAHSTSKKM